jgi:hypothetical protein
MVTLSDNDQAAVRLYAGLDTSSLLALLPALLACADAGKKQVNFFNDAAKNSADSDAAVAEALNEVAIALHGATNPNQEAVAAARANLQRLRQESAQLSESSASSNEEAMIRGLDYMGTALRWHRFAQEELESRGVLPSWPA